MPKKHSTPTTSYPGGYFCNFTDNSITLNLYSKDILSRKNPLDLQLAAQECLEEIRASLEAILGNQELILGNQELILAHQEAIQANLVTTRQVYQAPTVDYRGAKEATWEAIQGNLEPILGHLKLILGHLKLIKGNQVHLKDPL